MRVCDILIAVDVVFEVVVVVVVFVENDERQQFGETFGRMRNNGQRDGNLFGQDRDSDHQPNDCCSELHCRC